MTRYALIDSALFERPLGWAMSHGLTAVPLLPIDGAPQMGRITPWLTAPNPPATAELEALTDQSWGLWIDSDTPLASLPGLLADRRMMQDADGALVLLRWWDRRVLLPFWPALMPAQKAWLLWGMKRLGIPQPGGALWLEAPSVTPAALLSLDNVLLTALSDDMAAQRVAPMTAWIGQKWPKLSVEERAGLAIATVSLARRLGLEDRRDWQALAQLLALLGSGFLDDPLLAPLTEELFLTADRRRLVRNEGELLALGNARIASGGNSLSLLRSIFLHDHLAAHYEARPAELLVRQVYGERSAAFPADAIAAARTASDAALLADYPGASAIDRLRFWFIRLVLGSGFRDDPLRQEPAQAYASGGMAGLAASVLDNGQGAV
ncbi:DUF4123 domain-containing protein [Lacibacterium aquatile]|uniref:DUF4123 domain-containing protein n=1 Tax=Lacibacterium aquatile TaxID=1168082 RepID=A0ABW5DWM4_9PROT